MSTAVESTDRKPLTSTKTGTVTGDKRDKTRTVEVSFKAKEKKYGKYLTKRSRFQVHDLQNSSKEGDLVEIAACRPISKTKTWRLLRVVKEGHRHNE